MYRRTFKVLPRNTIVKKYCIVIWFMVTYHGALLAHGDSYDIPIYYCVARKSCIANDHIPYISNIIFREFYHTLCRGLPDDRGLVDDQRQEEETEADKEPHQDNPLGIIIQSRHSSTSTRTARYGSDAEPQDGDTSISSIIIHFVARTVCSPPVMLRV